jgi:phospholipase A1
MAHLQGLATCLLATLLACTSALAAEESSADKTGTQTTAPESAETPDALAQRGAEERAARANRFAITPYKPNYLLPVSYNNNPNQQYQALDEWEIKFQLSFRLEILPDLFGGQLHFAYTQQSYWQAYNSDLSRPFRETNYEPEVTWGYWLPRSPDGGLRYRGTLLGISHQSNGQSEPLSRSWNRLYANFVFDYREFYFSIRPWYRIPEGEKSSIDDPSGDNNPDILDYMGHGEFLAVWARGEQRVGLMLRNNFDSENRGAVQLDWSFPIQAKVLGYVQWYYGYGESLIDYNHRVNRLGVGVMLNNWL